jgi:hypothetical protein
MFEPRPFAFKAGRPAAGSGSSADEPEGKRSSVEYVLDQATFDGRWEGVAYRCEVCEEWTNRFAQLKPVYRVHRLCPAHLNRESLGRLYSRG